MSAISNVIAEKKAERRQLLAKAEVLAKQINDLEKELKPKATTKPATKSATKKTTKPARKGAKKK